MDAYVTESPKAPSDADTDAQEPAAVPRRKRRWLRWTALGASVVILAGAGAGWLVYNKLDGNIRTDAATENELERYEAQRPPAEPTDAQNILLIGSDNRGGGKGNDQYGQDSGTQRSDTTILLHLAADRKSATAVSIPRDLMVEVPACKRTDGQRVRPQHVQFNWSFEFAGAACTIRTVEKMTGIRIDHHMIVDFVGFKRMVDAVDGVEVCLTKPVNDKAAHLVLPAGRQTLHGEDALGYVRARKSLGNGSDTQRIERQQQFLGQLVKKIRSNGVLLNPGRLFPVLDAATSSLTTDPGLASLKDLYELVRGMRDIPADKVQFLTVPRQAYRYDANRDELVQPAAGRLFEQLRKDRPVVVRPAPTDGSRDPDNTADYDDPAQDGKKQDDNGQDGKNRDAKQQDGKNRHVTGSPEPSPSAPTFRGTTAERGICE
ncbi:LCP family protein [Streptomyces sp. MST-110588]|uniref:LCP family protein n=1 Tax=Streptomyces sp. MST-110588 TaxID=2833628 RepID=UPI001F5D711B|nr:LCP family protein [Streptomyces sp. MST-110588]UNO41684.1 LCP family protein [Streptomyces sp. MST-110588]